MSAEWKIDKDPAAWRAELLRLYDEAYARTHPDDPPGGSGVREPRRPRPAAPAEHLTIDADSVTP